MNKYSIGKLLKRNKDIVIVEDDREYKSVTIRIKYKGVLLREIKKGNQIGTKRQFKVAKGQFILSRIDARQGALGIVPEDLDGAIITNDFWAFDINKELLNIEYFNLLLKSPVFLNACIKASKGTTNRKRIQEDFFLGYELSIPTIKEQEKLVKKILLFDKVDKKIDETKEYLSLLRQAVLQESYENSQ
jgi:type I restriction enzyme, S subunit